MVRLVKIEKSKRANKKWDAIFEDTRTGRTRRVPFGAKGMNDYTITGDKVAREQYRRRHRKDLDTKDPTKPGYLSFYILWGDSKSMKQNISKYRKMFNL